MSKYEAELRRRLTSGESIEAIARWYLERSVADRLEWKDSSVFEVRFMKAIKHAWDRTGRLPSSRQELGNVLRDN
jgi:hypothetical protein